MSATTDVRAPARVGVRTTWRVELVKLGAQARTRAALALVVLAPAAFALVLQVSTGVPADTVFGRWVHETATALPLVALGFAGSWGFPALVALVAGDVLSGEDHHGTWATVLTRSAGRGAVFAGKVLAALTYALAAVALLAASAVVAGQAAGGSRPLVGLGGQEIAPGRAVALTALAWTSVVPGVLAFGAVALAVSALTRSSLAGLAVPVALGLLEQLGTLVDGAQPVAALLPGASFLAWHGLFADPSWSGPLVRADVVAAVWCAAGVAVAWWVLRGRDVTS